MSGDKRKGCRLPGMEKRRLHSQVPPMGLQDRGTIGEAKEVGKGEHSGRGTTSNGDTEVQNFTGQSSVFQSEVWESIWACSPKRPPARRGFLFQSTLVRLHVALLPRDQSTGSRASEVQRASWLQPLHQEVLRRLALLCSVLALVFSQILSK